LLGNRVGNFDVLYDPLADDQVMAGKFVTRDGVSTHDTWTSFPSRSVRNNPTQASDSPYSLNNYRIQASLDQDLALKATTRATLRVGAAATRTLLFNLSRKEHVTAARIDGVAVELLTQDSQGGRAPRPDENDTFLLIAPDAMAPGSTHELEIEHEGEVIIDRGNDVYLVDARSNWYPRARMEFALYDLEFRYPSDLTLVTPGEIVEDRTEGTWRTTRRRSSVPIRVAGFNLGRYQHIKSETGGFTIDVYGNRNLDPQLTPAPQVILRTEPARPANRTSTSRSTTTVMQTPPPDPVGRMKTVANDVTESLRYFTTLFGPPPLKTLNVSPVPGTTGLGFPGLIYLSTLAYLEETQRPVETRGERARLFFSDLMLAHEVAHQWWGNAVASASYRDEWLVEALAHYSALLWIEKKKGPQAMEAELNAMRADLLVDSADGKTIESFGPLVWGYRLKSAREADTWRVITYEKGTWVLHMLRQRMGDTAFFKMLTELRRRFEFDVISNERLAALVVEFLPKTLATGTGMPPVAASEATTAFFDSWVYGTGIPELRLQYTVSGRAPNFTVTGTIDQQNVARDYTLDVPIEIQLAAGQRRTIWVRTSDEQQPFSVRLTQAPSRIRINSTSVLAHIK
ncbi:MAG: M1 family aminopeptidase, partial [Acidobacteriota bacterium]